jgi:hypothetical protein
MRTLSILAISSLILTLMGCSHQEAQPATEAVAIGTAPERVAQVDRGGNRMEPLSPCAERPEDRANMLGGAPAEASSLAVLCTPDGQWRVASYNGEMTLSLVTDETGYQVVSRYGCSTPCGAANDPSGSVSPWPWIVRLRNIPGEEGTTAPGRVIFGQVWNSSVMYSGGGGSRQGLDLMEASSVNVGADADALGYLIKNLPLSAGVMIRACFSEKDSEERQGICHDEYDFASSLTLDQSNSSNYPSFRYSTIATSAPGPVSRNDDNTGPLRGTGTYRNRECSFTRKIVYEAFLGTLQFDRPAPDCTEFTQP